jgi:energy-coupling factor transport system permease protein
MVLALVTTNPYYLAIVLLCVLLVAALAPWSATGFASFRLMLTLGVAIGLFSIGVAAINGASGEHVLFDVPGPRFPEWFGGLRLGGPVTWEALAGASLRAMAILCVFLAFAVFSGAVSPVRLLRLAPASLFHASLVLTVGLALLPAIVQDTRRIREMQMLRGSRGGLRDMPGLVVPAILGGLERSLRLAEAMEARGYAATSRPPAFARLAGIVALPCLLAAIWCWYYTDARVLALAPAGLGLALLVFWLRASARGRTTTRLHADPVPPLQAVVAGAGLLLAVMLPFLRGQEWLVLAYNPFAGLAAPPFELGPALIALSIAWPAAFLFAAAREPEPALVPVPIAHDEALFP